MDYLVAGMVIAVFLGLIPASIAKGKGHSFVLWWIYGWAFWIVAMIHVCFIEDYNLTRAVSTLVEGCKQGQNQGGQESMPPANEFDRNADAIRKLKELLDMGAITQEEFDQKKKQLLDV